MAALEVKENDIPKPKLEIFCVYKHLDNDQEIEGTLISKLKKAGIINLHFIDIEQTEEANNLVKNSMFLYDEKIKHNALSHYGTWKEIRKQDDICVIFNDTVEFSDKFMEKLNYIFVQLCEPDFEHKNWEIVYLGYDMSDEDLVKNYDTYMVQNDEQPKIHPLDKNIFKGGLFGYILNKKSANKLYKYVKINGFIHEPDDLLVNDKIFSNELEIRPKLIFSSNNKNNQNYSFNDIYDSKYNN